MGRTICHRLIPLSLRHPGGRKGEIEQYKSKCGEFHIELRKRRDKNKCWRWCQETKKGVMVANMRPKVVRRMPRDVEQVVHDMHRHSWRQRHRRRIGTALRGSCEA